MSYTSSLIGQAETDFASTTGTSNNSLGKEAFLQLLVTQLTYQDPLDPMDDKEFVAELANFSSLEQLTNISEGITTLTDATKQQDMLGAVSFIGKDIRASGNQVIKDGEDISKVYYELGEDADTVVANILDESGYIVRTVDLGGQNAGEHEFTWDGLGFVGDEVEDGLYTVAISAQNAEGESLEVATEIVGTVDGIESDGGSYKLRLGSGRLIDFSSIREVINSSGSSADEDA